MEINIRAAKKEDCNRIMDLITELAIYEKAPEEVTVTMDEFVDAGFGSKPVWKAIVADVDGQVEGFALYYTRYSTWKGCRLYLEDFLVTDKMRGKGLGKQLFDAVLEIAKKENFNGMTWQVLDWNQPAINFYNKYASRIENGWLNGSLSKEQLHQF